MKNVLLFMICISLFSCKKKENSTPQQSLQSTADSINFLFEHTYNIGDAPTPNNTGSYHNNNIIFHANGTIREFSNKFDTTYNVSYIITRNNATSIYQNGIAIKVVVPDFTYTGLGEFLIFAEYAQKNSDTLTIGNYESGNILYNNKATLGCINGTVNNGFYLWLN